MASWRPPEGSWAPGGPHLAGSWTALGLLGGSWGPFWLSGRLLEALWAVPKASLYQDSEVVQNTAKPYILRGFRPSRKPPGRPKTFWNDPRTAFGA